MMIDKIKEDISGLSIEEIVDIAHYIDQTLEDLWQNDLTISHEEKVILDSRIKQLKQSSYKRYNLVELSEGLEAIKKQKRIEKELAVSISEGEKLELDQRLLLIEKGNTRTTNFKQVFKDLETWAIPSRTHRSSY